MLKSFLVQANYLFEPKYIELISTDKNEIIKLKRNPNLSSVDKGVYTLEKQPTGLSLSEKDVLGIDSGDTTRE